ncbi:MAG: hypothetical protein AAGF07_04020 [Patescibacteria group bacterium]
MPYVLFEGMDLSGKSSTVAKIQEINKIWTYQHLVLNQANPIYTLAKQVNKQGIYSTEVCGITYAAAIRADLELFQWPSMPTLQDSCNLLRSLAHHSALGNTAVVNYLVEISSEHPIFSKAYVFTASIEERRKRLAKRMSENPGCVSKSDTLIINNPELFEAMNEAIIKYAKEFFNAQIIDTTYVDQNTVVNQITSQI